MALAQHGRSLSKNVPLDIHFIGRSKTFDVLKSQRIEAGLQGRKRPKVGLRVVEEIPLFIGKKEIEGGFLDPKFSS